MHIMQITKSMLIIVSITQSYIGGRHHISGRAIISGSEYEQHCNDTLRYPRYDIGARFVWRDNNKTIIREDYRRSASNNDNDNNGRKKAIE